MSTRNNIFLIVDSVHSHISKNSKAHMHARGILFCAIPGGIAAHLQPADYAWFKTIKYSVVDSIEQWKLSDNFDYTRGGKIRPPSHDVVRGWLTRAWSCISCDTIVTSFRCCLLGPDDQLLLVTHTVYGAVFGSALAIHRNSETPIAGVCSSDGSDHNDAVVTSVDE